MLKNKSKWLFVFFLPALGATLLVQSLVTSEISYARCSSADGDKSCLDNNFKETQKAAPSLTPKKYQDIVDECQRTGSVGSVGIFPPRVPVNTPNTQAGNCSNAVRSCFQHESNPEACYDGKVAAYATRCNNGNVDAGDTGGTSGVGTNCGIDAAIERVNELEDKDYQTNGQKYSNYVDSLREACDNEERYKTPEERLACRERAKQYIDECYNAQGFNGGVPHTRVNDQALNECMRDKVGDPNMCEAVGGVPGKSTPSSPDIQPIDKCLDPPPQDDPDVKPDTPTDGPGSGITRTEKKCGAEARVNLLECDETGGASTFADVLRIFVVVLSFGVGIAAVGGIAWSAIQYSSAEDNQSNVSAARERIRNIVIGLILYGFMMAIVNWLVPGGIIGIG